MKRVSLALTAAILATVASSCGTEETPEARGAAVTQATTFLDRYVDPDGRVVRRDQGGDTVSEGQAYALLLATAAGDHARVTAVWRWTADNLRRDDGLLSWRWADGRLQDTNSATDADLDAARALVFAGDRFDDADLAAEGAALAGAVLDHATVSIGDDRILVAGNWARTPPYVVNPSYLSPVATEQLRVATGDPRWAEVGRTGRDHIADLLRDKALPPDWARVDTEGRITSAATAGGVRPAEATEPQFGLDAARVLPRFAESCAAEDRALAAETASVLAEPAEEIRAVHDLDGGSRVDWRHPLGLVAAAAAAEAADQPERATNLLDEATRLDRENPTYYGAAWAALGPILLRTDLLNTCP
ncbi:MAG: glycosyl hydrolase family 8 [Actinomycetota bacterium]|nr:glycosyl hydrolase family 8 [Actinomycetota bacterium]